MIDQKIEKFDTFDALRFFAFLKVFLFHIPIVNFPIFNFIKSGGGIAVCFFFSLSGFLITYLILEEKKHAGTFNVFNFLSRRALRIWPLYYIMLLFAFLTPQILSLVSIDNTGDGYEPNWFMSLLFLENYKMIMTDSFPNVSPLGVMWSLCVEEHFYLLWSGVLFFIPFKKTYLLIFVAIVIANISRYIFYLNGWAFLDIFTNLDYFAYGAIPAVMFSLFKDSITEFLNEITILLKTSVMAISMLIVLILSNIDFSYKDLIAPTILGMVFCIIIILVVFQNEIFNINKRNLFSVLGTFTYSLYLTHTIIINLFLKIFQKTDLDITSPIVALLFVLVAFSVTLAVSMLSYYIIEKPFLILKNRIR